MTTSRDSYHMSAKMAARSLSVSAIYILCTVLVICAAENCTFTIPSTESPGQCDTYDLSPQASKGPYKFPGTTTNNKPAMFYLNLCGNVPNASLPSACASLAPSPAYMVEDGSKTCVRLGDLKSAIAVSTVSLVAYLIAMTARTICGILTLVWL